MHNPNNRFIIVPSKRQHCELLLTIVNWQCSILSCYHFKVKNVETHGKNSHQEIESKCEQHDCISVKMLLKLNDQINFRKVICSVVMQWMQTNWNTQWETRCSVNRNILFMLKLLKYNTYLTLLLFEYMISNKILQRRINNHLKNSVYISYIQEQIEITKSYLYIFIE